VFYIASSHDIKLFHLKMITESGGNIDVEPIRSEEMASITKEQLNEMTIHGLYLSNGEVLVALETVEDNQLDFSLLKVKGVPRSDGPKKGGQQKTSKKFNFKLT
jgi:hypothetical protein